MVLVGMVEMAMVVTVMVVLMWYMCYEVLAPLIPTASLVYTITTNNNFRLLKVFFNNSTTTAATSLQSPQPSPQKTLMRKKSANIINHNFMDNGNNQNTPNWKRVQPPPFPPPL